MPANRINILSTRQLPETLLIKAFENNIRITTIPFIKTEKIKDAELLEHIEALAEQKITVVFTSVNAVEALTSTLTIKPDWDIYCIGGITKDTVINFFGEASVKRTARNAANLAEKIIGANITMPIIFFCSNHRLDRLPNILKAGGVNFKELIVYNTVETPVLIEKEYDGILFFSPSAVHSFFSVNTIPVETVLFAIGKTTGATIETYASNETNASEWPRQEQLIDQVINYYEQVKHGD
ncbi:uroporphyrinogen-III synthase [Ferruginibacter albus]|uniref:uroporphyrinogen-III synthase n=1 Tax=Ferruginibacter albus TaxID=2875540 RepID=UPI001CC518DA|nr:uroporphyrinogen-III synthase [Ferruginibacter albus]UAY51618.1 uroporphyrinogen-III synthase [Ferruginibacter albus]